MKFYLLYPSGYGFWVAGLAIQNPLWVLMQQQLTKKNKMKKKKIRRRLGGLAAGWVAVHAMSRGSASMAVKL